MIIQTRWSSEVHLREDVTQSSLWNNIKIYNKILLIIEMYSGINTIAFCLVICNL